MAKQMIWVTPANTQKIKTSVGTIYMEKGKPVEVPKGEVEHTGAVPYKTTKLSTASTETRKAKPAAKSDK